MALLKLALCGCWEEQQSLETQTERQDEGNERRLSSNSSMKKQCASGWYFT